MDNNPIQPTNISAEWLRNLLDEKARQRLGDESLAERLTHAIAQESFASPEGQPVIAEYRQLLASQAEAEAQAQLERRLTFLKRRIEKGECSDWEDKSQFDGIESLGNLLKSPEETSAG